MSKDLTRIKLQWLDKIAADSAVPATAFRVAYVLMGRYLDAKTGDAYPSQATLAEATGLKERATRKALNELAEAGYLALKKGGWGFQNRYRMAFPDRHGYAGQGDLLTGTDMPVNDGADRHDHAGQGDTIRHKRAGQRTPNPAHPCLSDRHIRAAESPLLNPLEKRDIGETPPYPPRIQNSDAPDRFEEFWEVYPRRVSKPAARKEFAKIAKSGEVSLDDVIEGARRYAGERHGQPERYTKHPGNWLASECWNDEPAAPRPAGGPQGDRPSFMEMALRNIGRAQ